jgi:hypothetical protein
MIIIGTEEISPRLVRSRENIKGPAKPQPPFQIRISNSAHLQYLRHSTFFCAIACTFNDQCHQPSICSTTLIQCRPFYHLLKRFTLIQRLPLLRFNCMLKTMDMPLRSKRRSPTAPRAGVHYARPREKSKKITKTYYALSAFQRHRNQGRSPSRS